MSKESKAKRRVSRRTVLASGGAVGLAGVAAACKYGTQLFLLRNAPEHVGPIPTTWTDSKVEGYRPFGKSGFEMSDISFGTSGLNDPNVVRRAIERGINYFDTSPDYSHTQSERSLGEGIRDFRRDRIMVASKFCTPSGHLDKDTPTDDIVRSVEDSLQRIGTD